MPKVCIKAPEIVMSGDVGLNAQFNVSTKAKIDSVSVAGGCECPDVPKEKEFNFISSLIGQTWACCPYCDRNEPI